MNICICGGGNITHALAGELKQNTEIDSVSILTRRPKCWSHQLSVYFDGIFNSKVNLDNVTDELEVLKEMDIIFITVPGNVRYEYLLKIKDYVSSKAILISVPSVGGINFMFDKLFPKNKYVCIQRVPHISRIIEYGREVNISKKKEIYAYISKNLSVQEFEYIKEILNIQILLLNSFWPLILSNSNPILHLAAMYSLLKTEYPCSKIPFIYSDVWNNETSKLALGMDAELEKIMKELNVLDFKNLLQHYEVGNYEELTMKLKSITSFKALQFPLVNIDNKYYIDKTSRYIVEDLPFGTCFIKLLASLLNINTPFVDKVIREIQTIIGIDFIDEQGNFNLDIWQEYVSFDFLSEIRKDL